MLSRRALDGLSPHSFMASPFWTLNLKRRKDTKRLFDTVAFIHAHVDDIPLLRGPDYSHRAVQDYALMRTLPNMLIAAPGDPMEVRACMRYLAANPQPSYLRLGKAGEPELHPSVPVVEPGKWLPIRPRPGATRTMLSTGATAERASHWCDEPAFADCSLHSMPLWSMAAKPLQAAQVDAWQQVITVEDHLEDAGFGAWLLESLDRVPTLRSRLVRKALDARVCGMVGMPGDPEPAWWSRPLNPQD